ncbi:Protein SMAX1-LIKE 3 [Frankliniella fusca]|uniref:Protein SMAX1-LIKE 3 n=1 Tax=Frankliniella fusca TaxID=407009 RepID=A0AAE1HM21_9NEOP|nr:Protein SMAX1-LIKE 3 [Frankliniella fusca]
MPAEGTFLIGWWFSRPCAMVGAQGNSGLDNKEDFKLFLFSNEKAFSCVLQVTEMEEIDVDATVRGLVCSILDEVENHAGEENIKLHLDLSSSSKKKETVKEVETSVRNIILGIIEDVWNRVDERLKRKDAELEADLALSESSSNEDNDWMMNLYERSADDCAQEMAEDLNRATSPKKERTRVPVSNDRYRGKKWMFEHLLDPLPPKTLKRPPEAVAKPSCAVKSKPPSQKTDAGKVILEVRAQAQKRRAEAMAKQKEELPVKITVKDVADRSLKSKTPSSATESPKGKVMADSPFKSTTPTSSKRVSRCISTASCSRDRSSSPLESDVESNISDSGLSSASVGSKTLQLMEEADDGSLVFRVPKEVVARACSQANRAKKERAPRKRGECSRNEQTCSSVKECEMFGYRVENRCGKNVYSFCQVCDTKTTNFDSHLKKVPLKCQAAHDGVDPKRLKAYNDAQFTRGMRGPIYLEDHVDKIASFHGDREKIRSHLKNLLGSVGVGLADKASEGMPVYEMAECFKFGYDTNDVLLKVTEAADTEVEEMEEG